MPRIFMDLLEKSSFLHTGICSYQPAHPCMQVFTYVFSHKFCYDYDKNFEKKIEKKIREITTFMPILRLGTAYSTPTKQMNSTKKMFFQKFFCEFLAKQNVHSRETGKVKRPFSRDFPTPYQSKREYLHILIKVSNICFKINPEVRKPQNSGLKGSNLIKVQNILKSLL